MAGAIPFALPNSSGFIPGTEIGGSLLGWNLKASATAEFILWDNKTEGKGSNFGPVSLNEKESIRDWFGPNGLRVLNGLYYELKSGTVSGVIFADIE